MDCPCSVVECSRYNPVFPKGNPTPFLYVCGEAPGEQEDIKQRPFIGPAGEVLRNALRTVNLASDTRICNPVMCRPVDSNGKNRTPLEHELENCSQFAKSDIVKSNPRRLLLLGKSAVYAFLGRKNPMRENLGKKFYWKNRIPTFIYYHPSYIIRQDNWMESQDYLNFINLLQEIQK
jgi:uracil-DNA glycosylase family 4